MASNNGTNNPSNTQPSAFTPAACQSRQATSIACATTGSTQARYLRLYATNSFAPLGTTSSLNGAGGQFDNTAYPPYGGWGSGPIGLSSASTWGFNGTGPGPTPTPFASTRPANSGPGAETSANRKSPPSGLNRRSNAN